MPAADWYADPLGRFEGRFFDGAQWTARVKANGRLVVDPDWDKEPATASGATATSTESDASATASTPAVRPRQPASEVHSAVPATATFQAAAHEPAPVSPAPAVASVDTETIAAIANDEELDATDPMFDYRSESPVRTVAVLSELELPAGSVSTGTAVADRPSRRWGYIAGAAVLGVVLLLVLLPRLLGGDGTASPVSDDLDAPFAASAADDGLGLPATDPTDSSATSDGAITGGGDNDATSDAGAGAQSAAEPVSDAMLVGSTTILNGRQMLIDLAIWHGSTVVNRDIILGPQASCWFGTLGEAVVENAHCGPVATTPGAKPRFDLVPLRFEDVEPGVIQARPLTDNVVIDATLPSGVEFFGLGGPVDPTELADPDRGERSDG